MPACTVCRTQGTYVSATEHETVKSEGVDNNVLRMRMPSTVLRMLSREKPRVENVLCRYLRKNKQSLSVYSDTPAELRNSVKKPVGI
jgi:hypothetical protein